MNKRAEKPEIVQKSPRNTRKFKNYLFLLDFSKDKKEIKRRKMTKKCIYCKKEISDESVIDFCERCGVGVWGQKMFNTIVKNMEAAREKTIWYRQTR